MEISDIGGLHQGANSTIFVNLDFAKVVIDTMQTGQINSFSVRWLPLLADWPGKWMPPPLESD